jgi:hypothetical protein
MGEGGYEMRPEHLETYCAPLTSDLCLTTQRGLVEKSALDTCRATKPRVTTYLGEVSSWS